MRGRHPGHPSSGPARRGGTGARDYTANQGWETFLAYEDPLQDILIGLLRLRKIPGADAERPAELRGSCSTVRELRVYGSAIAVHARDATKFQHPVIFLVKPHSRSHAFPRSEEGYFTLLMEEAERIARTKHRSAKLAVISGVGTRHHYRKLGYELEGAYMVKHLAPPVSRRRRKARSTL